MSARRRVFQDESFVVRQIVYKAFMMPVVAAYCQCMFTIKEYTDLRFTIVADKSVELVIVLYSQVSPACEWFHFACGKGG